MSDHEMKRTVLVVEDNELNREILLEILSDTYQVLQAENGKQGMELLEKNRARISLVLLDIQMPVMNGYEFLDAFQEQPYFSNIPIIVTTSSDSMSDEICCLEKGATDFVTKPYNPEVVLKRIASMIRLSEASVMLSKVEYDKLTGVFSKEFFFDRAARMLEQYPQEQFDIMCSDIEAFKLLNDRYSEEKGDQMLKFLAKTLQKELKDHEICGRIGGDIFAVLLRHREYREYRSLIAKFTNAFVLNGPIPVAAVCFGVCSKVSKKLTISAACDNALLAISGIKNQYGTRLAMYDQSIRQKLQREQDIAQNMEEALQKRQFKAYFQPKHNLQEDRIGGAEALVRWFHPEMGFMSPGEFIPLFEKNRFITKLDLYMLEEICKAMRAWIDAAYPVVPVSFNVSRVDFEQRNLVSSIERIVDGYRIPYELLHLEVTESAYIKDPNQVAAKVRLFKEEGFWIELDDFGSGYTSLNVLTELEPDVLKLDMGIVRNIHQDKQKTILSHILAMARSLGMETVAEGVETKEQAMELKEMGCTYAQGYYYSKPIPKEEYEAYFRGQRSGGALQTGVGVPDEKNLQAM